MKLTTIGVYLFLLITGTLYLGSGCANIGNPTGGAIDSLPPQLISSYPKQGALNFKDQVVRLEFDEYVALKDLQNQLIITPSMENPYETKINKNIVELKFEKPFADSTTYTFNFRNGIVDITEGNPAKDLYFAFSTGSYLDSLQIKGKVVVALNQKPIEGAIVALYAAQDTMQVTAHKPAYFARTDKKGVYELRNLKAGAYRVYAFADKNNNLTLQTRSEMYGFLGDTVQLNATPDSLQIELFALNTDVPKILSARPSAAYYDISFNKAMQSYELQPAASTTLPSNFIEGQKKIRIYPTSLGSDSLAIRLTAIDSLNQQLEENLYIKFEGSSRPKSPFAVEILPAKGSYISKNPTLKLQFSKPVDKVNFDSLYFVYDSLNLEPVSPQDLKWNDRRDAVSITKTLNPPKQQQAPVDANTDAQTLARRGTGIKEQGVILKIPKGTFIGVEKDTIDNQELNYKFATEAQTGTINGSIQTEAQNFLIQLLNASNYKVIEEVKNSKEYLFRMVQPGEYLIRVVIDKNGNGQWDPGNINTLELAEKIYISPKSITIKANWEIKNPEIIL